MTREANYKNQTAKAVMMAILAAGLYGISMPVSKVLVAEIPPTFMAALLYLGAGLGMLMVNMINVIAGRERVEAKITNQELPYVLGMIILDMAAPIFLMLGLRMTTSANAALLNNFEIVATSLIALYIFKEGIGKRMWLAIMLITVSSIVLSVNSFSSFSFSAGSIFVLLACVCWGFENNCTRMLSLKDPVQIVVIKGLGSGCGALIISLWLGAYTLNTGYILAALLLGFVAYGLSIFFYISAQRSLGAARTSAYYATAPFIGVLISWLLLQEGISGSFVIALIIMIIGSYLAVTEDHGHLHVHLEEAHDHKHNHSDGHHDHWHDETISGEHAHVHYHAATAHSHAHLPDLHHRHSH